MEQQAGISRLRAFITGAVAITLAGAAINLLIYVGERGLAADLLRYYWFRLSDVAVPLGVALEGVALAVGLAAGGPNPRAVDEKAVDGNAADGSQVDANENAPRRQSGGGNPRKRWLRYFGWFRYRWLTVLILIAGYHLADRTFDRINPPQPRSHKIDGVENFADWYDICEWIVDSGKIPPGARFLTPRMIQTFKWYTGRSEVATWKDIPQDAKAIVQWWARLQDIYGTGCAPPELRWRSTLTGLSPERLRQLRRQNAATT